MLSSQAPSTAVVVSELFPPAVGGTAVLMENVYGRLRSADVVVLTDAAASGGRTAQYPDGVRVVHRPIATDAWGLMASGAIRHHVRVGLEIRALCRQRPALVHTVRALPEGTAAFISRLITGTPYVCWCHGEEVATSLTSRELSFLMRRVYAHAAAVIANSAHTKNCLVKAGIDPSSIVVVHPGVDAARFRPDVEGRDDMRKRLAPDAEILLLSVGRLQRRKGHDLAIEALARLVSEFPGLRYVIVGEGAERTRLAELTARLGIERHVVFAGELPDDDLPACYAACDIFLLPNRVDGADLEGFGIVFLEAAAAGKPAIGGTTGGVPEAIEDDVTGLLVSGLDAGELAARIGALASSPARRAQLGAAGRARVLREFTWEKATHAIAALQAAHAA